MRPLAAREEGTLHSGTKPGLAPDPRHESSRLQGHWKGVQVSVSPLGLIVNAGSSFSKTLWHFSALYMMEGSMDFVVDLLKVRTLI